ncbi:hypothetical protein COB72_10665, partial [bacterium]
QKNPTELPGAWSRSGGEPTLQPETAESTTLGFVWTPEFLEGFSVTVDYFNIKKENLIFQPSTNEVLKDVANAGGTTGKVIEIGLFTTTFDTPDNRRIIVPNGAIFGGTIENVSFHDTRRVDVEVGTDYGADIDKTREILMATAKACENVLPDPGPGIVLAGLGGSSIDWSIRVWVNAADYWGVKDQLTRDVKYALDNADIGIPYPQMDVHIDGKVAQG